jgi:predicted DNA-binding transcriptional regulator AlpA
VKLLAGLSHVNKSWQHCASFCEFPSLRMERTKPANGAWRNRGGWAMAEPLLIPATLERLALTPSDTAKLLGISKAQLWKLHNSGRLPLPVYLSAKTPRWRRDELERWLAAGAPDRQTWQRIRAG